MYVRTLDMRKKAMPLNFSPRALRADNAPLSF